MRTALPDYLSGPLGQAGDLPSGHRHRLYFNGWDANLWKVSDEGKREALNALQKSSKSETSSVGALVARQKALAAVGGVVSVTARSTAPFVTGIGNEHPLETGFAFLDPYGVPYLPGSSVKGVLRRAAEELVLFEEDSRGWSLSRLWWNFGFDENSAYWGTTAKPKKGAIPLAGEERQGWKDAYDAAVSRSVQDLSERARLATLLEPVWPEGAKPGDQDVMQRMLEALATEPTARKKVHWKGRWKFWDCFPSLDNKPLSRDILNPHFPDYYQEKGSPTDDQSPKPILFLTLPTGARFQFFVKVGPAICEQEPASKDDPALLNTAFEHAFEWLAFGGKKGAGLGRMRREGGSQPAASAVNATGALLSVPAAPPVDPIEENLERLCKRLQQAKKDDPDDIYQKELDKFTGEQQERLARALKDAYIRQELWKSKHCKTPAQKERVAKLKKILGEP